MSDHNYEASINALIPQAERTADIQVPKSNYEEVINGKKVFHHDEWGTAWNRVYHREMAVLAHESGLRTNYRW